jgi:hypothetical protein
MIWKRVQLPKGMAYLIGGLQSILIIIIFSLLVLFAASAIHYSSLSQLDIWSMGIFLTGGIKCSFFT